MSRLFGTDGARDLVGQGPITPEGAEQMGRAVGVHFALNGERALVAGDTRESSTWLMEGVAAGIVAVGGTVEMLDTFTTPGLALRVRDIDYVAAGDRKSVV